MIRRDHPVLRSRRRNRSVPPARGAQSRRNVHQKRTGTPMSVSEFRCLAFSFCRSQGAKPSLCVFAGEIGEMPVNEPLIDPQFTTWVVRLRFDLLDDPTYFESIAVRDWF